MSVTLGNFNLTEQIWQRFITKADTNSDNRLNQQELKALAGDGQTDDGIRKILEGLDQDGDGQLSLSEFSAKPFHEQPFRNLTSIQEATDADRERVAAETQEDIAQLFERADVDKDGRISKEEWEADGRMNTTRYLTGDSERAQTDFLIVKQSGETAQKKYTSNWDYITPQDVIIPRIVGHLDLVTLDDMSQEMRRSVEEDLEQMKESVGYQAPQTKEERDSQLGSGILNKPLTSAYVARRFAQLTEVATE